jgi:hypothetical protein
VTSASAFQVILRFLAAALVATLTAMLLGTLVAVLAFVPPGVGWRLDGLLMFGFMGALVGVPLALTMGTMMIMLSALYPKLGNAYIWAVAGMFGAMPVILLAVAPAPFGFYHRVFMIACIFVGAISALVFLWVWRGGSRARGD